MRGRRRPKLSQVIKRIKRCRCSVKRTTEAIERSLLVRDVHGPVERIAPGVVDFTEHNTRRVVGVNTEPSRLQIV